MVGHTLIEASSSVNQQHQLPLALSSSQVRPDCFVKQKTLLLPRTRTSDKTSKPARARRRQETNHDNLVPQTLRYDNLLRTTPRPRWPPRERKRIAPRWLQENKRTSTAPAMPSVRTNKWVMWHCTTTMGFSSAVGSPGRLASTCLIDVLSMERRTRGIWRNWEESPKEEGTWRH